MSPKGKKKFERKILSKLNRSPLILAANERKSARKKSLVAKNCVIVFPHFITHWLSPFP
jgi:hypothetical protein